MLPFIYKPYFSLIAILTCFIVTFILSAKIKKASLNTLHIINAFIILFVCGTLTYLTQISHQLKNINLTLLTFNSNLNIAFFTDSIGLYFGTLAVFLWLLTLLYAKPYFKKYLNAPLRTFYVCFALSIMSLLGMCFSKNFFTFFIFFELLSLFTYPLVIHKRSPEAFKAGKKYLLYTLTGGQFLLFGLLILQQWLSLDFSHQAQHILTIDNPSLFYIAYLLAFFGLAVKTALMPLHGWLPSAMVAPTPVSALLHAVAVVKAGALGIYRLNVHIIPKDILHFSHIHTVLLIMCCITIVLASCIALKHTHIKRRLAYSTIGQISYITLGTLIGTPIAIAAAGMHFFAHALQKICLFWVAGIFQSQKGINDIKELESEAYEFPLVSICFFLCSLGLAGLPGFIGYLSKEHLLHAAAQEHLPWVMIALLLSGFLNLSYLIPISIHSCKNKPENAGKQLPWQMALPPIICTCLAVYIGLNSKFFLDIFLKNIAH